MSKNHPHDNIYSILGKLDALKPTPAEERFALVKEIRESVEAQGSILSGVDAVQAKLARRFAEAKESKPDFLDLDKDGDKKEPMKKAKKDKDESCADCELGECSTHSMTEAEITRKPGVTTHRKTDFPGYPVDEPEDIDDENKGKRGRPRKHAKKEPTGLGRGRPKKAAAVGSSAPKMHDPFGRVKAGAEKKSAVKGRVHSVMESVNFKRMMEEQHMTLAEMLDAMSADMEQFKETGVCSDRLRDMMEVFAHAKKQMEETQGGIGHDLVTPHQRVAQATPAKPGIMGAVKDVAQGASNWLRGKPEQGPTYEEVDPLEEELRQLAELAGVKIADEGNAFSGKLAQAKAQHQDKFNVDGKEYEVKEADAPVDEPVEGELENEPSPKYGTIKNITTQGDDLNRQKRQDPGTANRAANPLTNSPIKLEAKLAAEYESIKKASK